MFEFVWIPITLVKIRSSVRAEHLARGQADRANESAFNVGFASWLLYLATNILVLLPYGSDALLVVAVLAELTFLGLWIAYWVKLSHLKNDLMLDPGIVGAIVAPQASGDRCSSCGAAVYEGDEYCRLCGAATGSEMGSAASAATGTSVVPAPAEPTSSEAAIGGDRARPAWGRPLVRSALRPIARTRSSARRVVGRGCRY